MKKKIVFLKLLAFGMALSLLSGCGTSVTDTIGESSVFDTKDTASYSQTSESSEIETVDTSDIEVSGDLSVHFIDVGQADSIFIELPNDQTMLIDAGNNADRQTILNYIDSCDTKKIDYLVGTHPHEDHIGSMDDVIANYDIGNIYLPRVADKLTPTTATYEDLLESISNKDYKIDQANVGTNIFNFKNLKADIISPIGEYDDLNNYSAVIKLTYGDVSFLFTGDAEEVAEGRITSDLHADVLKVGHHGSDTSTSKSFLEKVSPKYAIISVGKDNSYGHPSAGILTSLNEIGAEIYRTDEVGSITVDTDGKTIKVDKKASTIKENAPPPESTSSIISSTAPEPVSSEAPVIEEPEPEPEPQKTEVTVYITKTGEKYHRDGCQYLRKSQIATSLESAKSRGYTPCSRCHPPV